MFAPALTFSLSVSYSMLMCVKENNGKGFNIMRRNTKCDYEIAFIISPYASRQTPRAITGVLVEQTNKAFEGSLEEEKLNPQRSFSDSS